MPTSLLYGIRTRVFPCQHLQRARSISICRRKVLVQSSADCNGYRFVTTVGGNVNLWNLRQSSSNDFGLLPLTL